MAKRRTERGPIWWLAYGSSKRSRRPSFAPPPTARPAEMTSYYHFGWDREQACFLTSAQHDVLRPAKTTKHPCDPEMAAQILRRCAQDNVARRFFTNYSSEPDADIFAAAGYLFGIARSRQRAFDTALVHLSFYAPGGAVQSVSLHDGMAEDFGRRMAHMKIAEIRAQMR